MRRTLLAVALALCLTAPAAAQSTYPARPITVIVPFAAGGATDIVARLMADHMGRTLGQTLVVENATGAGGTVGSARVARAAPDGYTLLMGNLGTHAASVGLYPKLAYDPRADFAPIINAGATPMLVVAKNDLPVRDFREFVAYVRANGARMNYGSGGFGSTSHLTCLFLDSLTGASPQHVPYRGSGPALHALLGGQVDYVCDQTVSVVPSVQAGTAKGLVVAVPERVAVIPDVPTSAEQGLPDFRAAGWNALFAPKGTAPEIVARLNAAARAALADAAIRRRLLDLGADLPSEAEQSPEAMGALVRAEIEKWVPVIRRAGVTAE